MIVNITVEFEDDGTAIVRLPEGKSMKMDQAKVGEFTMKLAKGMGNIIERHKGLNHGHIMDNNPDHVHLGE